MTTEAQSSNHSSPESYEDDSNMAHEDRWSSPQDQESTSPSFGERAGSSSQDTKSAHSMQKRRRVTRACDECRRKKIKCDGKQPCTHCTVYSYECTYDQPSNRRRNPAPQYIEAIENRLHQAEALLKTVLPDVNLNDPNFANAIPHNLQRPASSTFRTQGGTTAGPKGASATAASTCGDAENDSLLESMVRRTGTLDLDDRGNWDYHGHSSGLIFLRRMKEQFGDLMGQAEGHGSTFLQTRPEARVIDSPSSAIASPMSCNIPNVQALPDKACGLMLSQNALDDACALMRFVHQPTYYAMFNRIYDTPPEQYGNEENKNLPLVYAVMAVGSLFGKTEKSKLELEGYESATDQGFKYFRASRQLMDIADCRDLPSLQAIIFLTMFLQSAARLGTCYTYIGVALNSAIRMGLHRSFTTAFNPIELETRKRVFWQIRKMDFYVAALLGLPLMLSEDDIDQDEPLEIDDEYITIDEVLPMPPGQISLFAATNAHTKLTVILQKVVKYIYPLKGSGRGPEQSSTAYVVSHAKIREIEHDLQLWMEKLPMDLRPSGSETPELARVQQLLRLAYAHVQMILYRPFLHYVTQSYHTGKVDKRSYACAAACVSVSRNIVHITAEMKRRGLLIGAYWFTMYTTFFAILALAFFVLENPNSNTTHDILRDALEGKEILASLAKRSMAADRCTVTLAGLFDQLPGKVERGGSQSSTTRKRQATSPHPTSQERGTHNTPRAVPSRNTIFEHSGSVPRASTFPKNQSLMTWKRASLPYISSPLIDNKQQNSQDPYTPSASDQAGTMTPESNASSSIPYSSGIHPYGAHQGFSSTGGFPDFSAMMFPSNDPFAYPNQPMTMLETGQFGKKENNIDHNDTNNIYSGNPTTSNAHYENFGIELFGPLPPYLMGGQQPNMTIPNTDREMDMRGSSEWDLPPQVRGRGLNMDGMYGDGWENGWGNQGGFGQ
ncbi:hypothetical protein MMC13_008171 [Lambiella insularis]|nr:hypothetical protein [Lambiella insularis]